MKNMFGVLALGFLLTACGGSDSDPGSAVSPPITTPSPVEDDESNNDNEPGDTDHANDNNESEADDTDGSEDSADERDRLSDPRGKVFEFVRTEGGVESREYLVIRAPNSYEQNPATIFAFTDNGECYARPTEENLNGPLHQSEVIRAQDGFDHTFRAALMLHDTYSYSLDDLRRNWHVLWSTGADGYIEKISLVDKDGLVLASATEEDGALEYTLEDYGIETSINVPFGAVSDLSPDDIMDNVCESNIVAPAVYDSFEIEFEGGAYGAMSLDYGLIIDQATYAQSFYGASLTDEIEGGRFMYVGFMEVELEDSTMCLYDSFVISLSHDYRTGGFFSFSNWDSSEDRELFLLTADSDGVISGSTNDQIGVKPIDMSFEDLRSQFCILD